MKLKYKDFEGKVHYARAKITTDHPASSYGQPVIVLEDGGAIDWISWVGLGYQVVKATQKELDDLRRMGLL